MSISLSEYFLLFSFSLNSKEAYAFAALKYAIGAGPQIKYGTGVSPFSKAVQSFKHPVGISAFNISYSDAGLFGVAFVTPGQQAAEVGLYLLIQLHLHFCIGFGRNSQES